MLDKKYPAPFQQRILWRAATGLSLLILGVLIVGLVWLIARTLSYLQPVLIPLAVAGIIAYLLDPLCRYLQTKGLSRMKAIMAVFGSIFIIVALLCYAIASPLSDQIRDLFSKKSASESVIPSSFSAKQIDHAKENKIYGWMVERAYSKNLPAIKKARETGANFVLPDGSTWASEQAEDPLPEAISGPWSSELANANFRYTNAGVRLSEFRDSAVTWFMSSGGRLIGGKILVFFSVIIGIVMVPIYLYFFLKESNSIRNHWHDYIPLRASHFKDEVVSTLAEINGYLISFFRGQVLVAFIDGILVGIALTVFQLPYGLLIGIFMAILGIIPFLGNIICLIPACIIAFVHGGAAHPFGLPAWGYVAGVLVIFTLVQQFDSLVTAPKIVGDSVGLHPMTVIFSIIFWSLVLGGFLGALLAIPLTAALKVLFRRYIWQKKIIDPEDVDTEPAVT